MLINDAIEYTSTAYKSIKNKKRSIKVKAMFDNGVDDYVVNEGIDFIGEQFN